MIMIAGSGGGPRSGAVLIMIAGSGGGPRSGAALIMIGDHESKAGYASLFASSTRT
jgi:hypothetical protein